MTRSQRHTLTSAGNLRAILAVLAGTMFFTVVDVIMKLSLERLPVGEAIVIRNTIATVLITGFAALIGHLRLPRNPPWRLLAWRMIGEGGSTIMFLSALASLPIAEAAGIGQFAPLALIAAAAIFLRERVGWRRWLATFAGLVGVMLIMRPGTAAFSFAGLLVLAAIALNIIRDFATRGIASSISTLTLTTMSSLATLIAGIALLPFETWHMPGMYDVALLTLAGLFLLGGYATYIIAMRNGEVSAATPFRYSGMVAALFAGWLIWNEVPDTLSLIGIAIVCAAGAYTLHRERLRQVASPKEPDAPVHS